MTVWKDGGQYGNYLREITDETGRQSICHVRTQCNKYTEEDTHRKWTIVPWPKGEANFWLILNAPQMMEALETIQHRAEYMLEGADSFVDSANWEKVRGIAHAAIAAVKGEGDDL